MQVRLQQVIRERLGKLHTYHTAFFYVYGICAVLNNVGEGVLLTSKFHHSREIPSLSFSLYIGVHFFHS